jgi:hypothetical protein
MKSLTENIKAILALFIALASFSYLFMITLLHPDSQVLSQAIIAVVGVLGTATGYYFGSSAAKKDEVPAIVGGDNITNNTTAQNTTT